MPSSQPRIAVVCSRPGLAPTPEGILRRTEPLNGRPLPGHSNLPVRIGPLNWIFSMTELHRWHHSKPMHESNHNYGGNLIVWDILFGTRWVPDDRDPPEAIGMESLPGFPMGFWANLASPFRWQRVVAESRAPDPLETRRSRSIDRLPVTR